tara:strand:+ start:4980 stop:6083 length:1104 start_codon:yes stop_codon:yes gene_type:complete
VKIERVSTWAIALPADEPLAQAPENPDARRPVVAVEITTDEGVVGIGVTFFGAALTLSLRRAVQQLGELLLGDDPAQMDAIIAKLNRAAGGSGPSGIFTLALSAIEIALWDIKGKTGGQPLWQMLGGDGASVPTYASGAMMRGLPLDRALASAGHLVQTGFTAMKFQLALPESTPESEIERARLIRQTVGDDIELMCDINQLWSLDMALEMGRRLEDIHLAWLEDPTAHDDYAGLSRLASSLVTPIAVGEYLYGLTPFRHLIAAGGTDIVMIDPFRAGGIGAWLKIARLAEENGLRVVSHLAPEIQMHLINAVPNGWTVEYMPWFHLLYEEVVWPQKGQLALPKTPGLGLVFNKEILDRHCMEHDVS